MTACSCGHVADQGARFCQQCGLVLAQDLDQAGAGAADNDGSTLLLSSAEPATVSDDVVSGRSTRSILAFGLLGLVVVGLLVALWPSARSEELAQSEESAEAEESGESKQATSVPEADRTNSTMASGLSPARSSTTTAAPEDDGSTRPLRQQPRINDEPVLGEESNLGLVLADERGLFLLDLDTAQETQLVDYPVQILASVGTHVVFQRDSEPVNIQTIDILQPGRSPVPLAHPAGWSWVQAIDEDKLVVWVDTDNDEGTARAYSLIDGTEVPELTFPLGGWVPWSPGFASGVNVMNGSGGVFVRQDDGGYRRVDDGLAIGVGNNIAAINDCADDLTCITSWYTIEPWTRLDYPTLEPSGSFNVQTVLGDDRWTIDHTGLGFELSEVETGTTVRTWESGSTEFIDVSPDGRWLVDLTWETGPAMVDLDDGVELPLTGDLGDLQGDKVTFIELG